MKTRVTDLFHIQYPVIQGGMAWVADASLAAAVSNAGGLGLLAGASHPAEEVRKQILHAKELTDKPFGLNIMLMSEHSADLVQLAIEEHLSVVATGAGNPAKYIPSLKEAGVKVLPVIPSVAIAKKMEKAGADAVVAEGCESGGHIGEMTTMALVPQVVDAISIPVIAAGGIADGRGMAASLMLGAEGVQMGTRFLAAKECNISRTYQQMVLDASDSDSVVTGRTFGRGVRSLKSPLSQRLLEMEKNGAQFEEIEALTMDSLRKAVQQEDLENGSFMAGQIAGLVHQCQSAKEIVEEIVFQAEKLLKKYS